MCGISGIILSNPAELVDKDILTAMNRSLAHRGPDGEGYEYKSGVGIAHRRLAIIDPKGGHQPWVDTSADLLLTFNGQIYNYRSLRDQLSGMGHSFTSQSDTEVLMAAYREWGERCVDYLDGMFAFAIWDEGKKRLFAARDRLGIKPFYYGKTLDGGFVFGSELKALLAHPNFERRLRYDAVEDYLALGYVPDPKTILKDAHKLAPGHCLTIDQSQTSKLEIRQYWSPKVHSVSSDKDMLDELNKAVKSHLVSDVPVGAFLSGGLDSSAIVATMSELMDEPVKTCTIAADGMDESSYASMVAQKFGTSHESRNAADNLETHIEKLAGIYDEPFADPSALPTYAVCALAREKVTVALSGDGADELFGGYRRYRFHVAEEKLRRLLPGSIRRAIFGTLGKLYPKLDWAPQWLRAKSTFQGLSRSSSDAYLASVGKISPQIRDALRGQSLRQHLDGYRTENWFQELEQKARKQGSHDPLTDIQLIDLMSYLPGGILTKTDRASMANSLEVRVPFLDHHMAEYAFGLPADQRLNDGGKAVLRASVRGILPDEILDRPKQGFIAPIAQWMRGPLKSRIEKLGHSRTLVENGLLNGGAVQQLIDQHMSGAYDHHEALWSLFMLDETLNKIGV